MYLSKNKLLFSQLVSWITVLWTAFGIFLGIVGIGLCISAMNGNYNVIEEDEIESHFAVYIAFIIVPGAFLIWAVRNLKLAGKANKFNSMFESDPDGVISAERASRLFGKNVYELTDLFDKLVKKGYLINCSLQNPDNPVFVLNNGAETVEERYDIIHCPNCGAPNSVKYGFIEQCQYCGSKVNMSVKKNIR
ncbi:MAG: zinc ribbon domain-containing protein [Ruminococcus sp.]|nr:zinc ribbon domain-containing protein [Ruminococcus sp.]